MATLALPSLVFILLDVCLLRHIVAWLGEPTGRLAREIVPLSREQRSKVFKDIRVLPVFGARLEILVQQPGKIVF